jgi:hypothetical protein
MDEGNTQAESTDPDLNMQLAEFLTGEDSQRRTEAVDAARRLLTVNTSFKYGVAGTGSAPELQVLGIPADNPSAPTPQQPQVGLLSLYLVHSCCHRVQAGSLTVHAGQLAGPGGHAHGMGAKQRHQRRTDPALRAARSGAAANPAASAAITGS